MTAEQLIDKLQEFSPDTEVYAPSYEEGYRVVSEVILDSDGDLIILTED